MLESYEQLLYVYRRRAYDKLSYLVTRMGSNGREDLELLFLFLSACHSAAFPTCLSLSSSYLPTSNRSGTAPHSDCPFEGHPCLPAAAFQPASSTQFKFQITNRFPLQALTPLAHQFTPILAICPQSVFMWPSESVTT